MKGMIAVLVVASLLGAGCSRNGDSEAAPEIDDSTAAQLQARAFQRACQDVICAGAPIYAPDSTPEGIPEYEDFLKVVEAIDELEDAGSWSFGAAEDEEINKLVMNVFPAARDTEEFKEFTRILRLDPQSDTYRVSIGLLRGGEDQIIIETRPIMSAMFYIGQSIELPEEIIDKNTILVVRDESGQPFDWQKVFKGLVRIRSSSKRPLNSYATVAYEGYWYFIADDDIDSRETLTMLNIVLSLTAGGVPSKAPILTVPVGGG